MEVQNGSGFGIVSMIISLAIYVYIAYSVMVIANKTNTPNGWLAWIPIVNLYLMCKIADKPGWWLILFLVPLVNVVFLILVWMGIAQARGKASWLGILMIIPVVNLIIPGYLAFAD